MAKHKGKRTKSRRDSSGGSTAEAEDRDSVPAQAGTAQRASARPEAVSPAPDKTLRVESNVIQFPKAATSEADEVPARIAHPTMPAGTGALLSEPAGLAPPSEPGDDSARPQTVTRIDVASEAKSDATEASTPHDPPGDKVPEAKAEPKPFGKITLRSDPKLGRQDRKESLSTHLSEEAKAFFADEAYAKAYKQHHDTFDDLVPAAEDHAHETARSRRWMNLTGALLAGVVVVVASFGLYRQMVPQETVLTPNNVHLPAPAPTTPPTAPANPVAASPPAPQNPDPTPAVSNSEPIVPQNPTTPPDPAVALTTPPTAPQAPDPTAPVPIPIPIPIPEPNVAPEPVAPPAAVNPSPPAPVAGQTPAQLLAAARAFRGPLAGRMAAYNTYFDAAPTDVRTMTTLATSLAEAHPAEAESVALRATQAAATNSEAWFLLAFARHQLHNRAGETEARTRCIQLGGRWAAECRVL